MNSLIKKLSGFKGIGFIVLAMVAGVILLIWPDGESDNANINLSATADTENYIAEAEKQARELILGIEGVESCEVMITVSDGYSYLYASNQRVMNNGDAQDVEKEVVVVTENGNQKPIVVCEYTPKITGIAVVYNGDSVVAGRIKSLLSVLFGVSDEYIYVTT